MRRFCAVALILTAVICGCTLVPFRVRDWKRDIAPEDIAKIDAQTIDWLEKNSDRIVGWYLLIQPPGPVRSPHMPSTDEVYQYRELGREVGDLSSKQALGMPIDAHRLEELKAAFQELYKITREQERNYRIATGDHNESIVRPFAMEFFDRLERIKGVKCVRRPSPERRYRSSYFDLIIEAQREAIAELVAMPEVAEISYDPGVK